MILETKSDRFVKIPMDGVYLEGILTLPESATGLVIFAHGSGSSRFSKRNNYVAQVLNHSHIGTLLFDLLTEKEDFVYENRFNIDLLTRRLISVTQWIKQQPETKTMQVAYFGASTGAASALNAAATLGENIKAVVSRGGRPDLAMPVLDKVLAPTLLIVGGLDTVVINMNKDAFGKIKGEKKMEIVPGASHLFEEPGTLEAVAKLANEWFIKYFV